MDQFDRPIAGTINMCLDSINIDPDDIHGDDNIKLSVNTVVHEVSHILGMLGAIMPYMWDTSTKEPRTKRPIYARNVQCVDGEIQTVAIPDTNTLQFQSNNEQISAILVTPKVRTVARNHFNCRDLDGAQLENTPTSAYCYGSHWDERYFLTETLGAVTTQTKVYFSPLSEYLLDNKLHPFD